MIERARAGQKVVRLKGGDPLVFGRGGEETEALQKAGIRYEIVPGVTAALAAAAFLDIPLTHRRHASAVALITGHELPNKAGNILNWKALAKFPGTLAIYMGVARLPLLVAELLKHGKDPNTPSCLVERAGTGAMRSVSARLVDLDEARRQAGLEAPGLILIGEVVGLRHDPSWFESRPLFGHRVLVTRPRHQADGMIRRLETLGAVPVLLPGIDIREPSDWQPLDAAIDRLATGGWDWIAFTSANGVRFFLDRLLDRKRDIRSLGAVKLAAVGSKTAEALRDYRLVADLIPDSAYSGQALAEQLLPHVRGKRVLLPRAREGNDDLRQSSCRSCGRSRRDRLRTSARRECRRRNSGRDATRGNPLHHVGECQYGQGDHGIVRRRDCVAGLFAGKCKSRRSAGTSRPLSNRKDCRLPPLRNGRRPDGLIAAVIQLAERT